MSLISNKYFESHAHYDDERFPDRDELLGRALPAANVGLIINIGADMESSVASVALAAKYDYVYAAAGVHPHGAGDMRDEDLDSLLALSRAPKVVAVGEIGLDYHYDKSRKAIQQQRFREQLAVAEEAGLPVVIHSREADFDTFRIIEKSPGTRRGVVHCFSGGPELALEYAKLGFCVGFGGVITFPGAADTVKSAAVLPLDRILIETDCPYLSPAPNRGKRNDSGNLRFICEKLAQIKGVTADEIARITWENGEKLFGLTPARTI